MNAVTIEPPATPDSWAGAGLWELGGGALLAFAAHTAEIPPGGDLRAPRLIADLRRFLEAEHERLAGFLPSLAAEEIPFLLADLLTRGRLPADAACVLALSKEGEVHVLASGGAAAYLAPKATTEETEGTGAPVRRVIDGAVSFLLPGAPSGDVAPGLPRLSGTPGASRRFLRSEVVRLPLAGALVVLLSGEVEPALRERLLAALQSAREPATLEPLLRGAVERAGLALLAYSVGGTAREPRRDLPEGIETELAALRREVERRLVRLDGRLKDVEELATGFASAGRPRFTFPGLPSLARPKPPLPRRPGAEEAGSADDGPKFERGLDVPVASNWSRPLLLVTGGITLLLFLLVQLFCPAPPLRRRVVPMQKPMQKVVPAAAPVGAAGQKPPVGVLLVTPTSEPEGTEPPVHPPVHQ